MSIDLKAESKYWGKKPTARECVQQVYYSQVGVKEATGHNDGREVYKYQKSVGIKQGDSWCAAFAHWCLIQCGIKNSITGWSPTALNKKNLVYYNRKWLKPFKAAMVFTLYSNSKKRVSHTGFVDEMISDGMVQTVEGNTNSNGSSNGDGVYIRFRPVRTLYSISDFIE